MRFEYGVILNGSQTLPFALWFSPEFEYGVIPLISKIACGEPIFAVKNIEDNFVFPKSLFGAGVLNRTYAGLKYIHLKIVRKEGL